MANRLVLAAPYSDSDTRTLYMGVYRVDRRWTNGRPLKREAHDVHEHVVLSPSLVTREEFERTQDLLARRKPRRPPRRNPEMQEGLYSGFLDCAECGYTIWTHPSTWKNAAAYRCPTPRCSTGFTSTRLADPQVDRALESRLGSIETLAALVDTALVEGDRRGSGSVRAHERRLAEIDNGRQRAVDLYVDGKIDRAEFDKRHDALRAEARALGRLLAEASAGAPELTPDVMSRLASLFSNWTLLRREEKRAVLHEFGARVVVARPRKRHLDLRELRLAALDARLVYKKMKRLGIG